MCKDDNNLIFYLIISEKNNVNFIFAFKDPNLSKISRLFTLTMNIA